MNTHWTERLSEYIDGELSSAERTDCEAHLSTCGPCRVAADELRTVIAAAKADRDRMPTADLWPGVLARIAPAQAGALTGAPIAPAKAGALTDATKAGALAGAEVISTRAEVVSIGAVRARASAQAITSLQHYSADEGPGFSPALARAITSVSPAVSLLVRESRDLPAPTGRPPVQRAPPPALFSPRLGDPARSMFQPGTAA